MNPFLLRSDVDFVIPDCRVSGKSGIHMPCLAAIRSEHKQRRPGLWIPGPRYARPGMTSKAVPAMHLHPSCHSSGTKARLERTRGLFLLPFIMREAERRMAHPIPIAAPERGPAAVICDRTPSGAPPRSCAGIIHPNSAWAALPGITGSKREDPLRHQCSEHLAVRSRVGRADAQAARARSVSLHAREPPPLRLQEYPREGVLRRAGC